MKVFDIQRGSFHDGPGIRTVVFLKGCNMSCTWCQNPESVSGQMQMMYYETMCSKCGECVEICPAKALYLENGQVHYDASKCTLCRKCEDVCCYDARYFVGDEISEEDIFQEVMEDREMYRISGGGLTLSGGEPLLQPRACRRLLKLAKEQKIHTLIETAGNLEWGCFEEVRPFTDQFYIDLKMMDEDMHKKYCGCSNNRILFNIEKLQYAGMNIKVRTPVVPGVNDDEESIRQIALFLRKIGVRDYQLMPFHSLGNNKYTALGKQYEWKDGKTPSQEKMEILRNIARREGRLECE